MGLVLVQENPARLVLAGFGCLSIYWKRCLIGDLCNMARQCNQSKYSGDFVFDTQPRIYNNAAIRRVMTMVKDVSPSMLGLSLHYLPKPDCL